MPTEDQKMSASYCEYGEHKAKSHQCEVCGVTYCKGHAARPDEGGWDCPAQDCAGHPCGGAR